MSDLKLYMLLLGCRPKGRLTEQHDVFFGIARELKDLIAHIKLFWPEAKGNVHIDAWREVTQVNEFKIQVVIKRKEDSQTSKLFFLNLGGYKLNEFDEFHYKILAVAPTSGEAIQQAKQTAFYQHTGFKGATSHIDDKYGIDIDDVFPVAEILPEFFKNNYSIQITEQKINAEEDKMHLGYLPLKKIK